MRRFLLSSTMLLLGMAFLCWTVQAQEKTEPKKTTEKKAADTKDKEPVVVPKAGAKPGKVTKKEGLVLKITSAKVKTSDVSVSVKNNSKKPAKASQVEVDVIRVNQVVGTGKASVAALKAGQSKTVKIRTNAILKSKDVIKARDGSATALKTLK